MLADTATLGQVLAEDSALLETVTVNRARRYKTPNGGTYPSVTNAISILDKPALLHWSGTVERELCVETFMAILADGGMPADDPRGYILDKIGTKLACYRKRDEAGDTGTTTHALIEHHLKLQLGYAGLVEPEIPETPQGEAALWAYIQFEEFARSVDFEPIAMEIAVWSESGFAGRFDLLARINGELSILDWKTGKDIYAEAKLQNAAYRLATNERLAALGRSERVTAGHIVLLPKVVSSDTAFRVEAIADDAAARDGFLAALSLWNAMESLKKGGKK